MIVVNRLNKSYGDLKVLSEVDLTIEKKEIVAITGPSGAGKTTLLNVLGTLDKPDLGPQTKLIVNDIEVLNLKGDSLAKFRNEQLGFVFQSHQLLPEFSALENVCIPAFIMSAAATTSRSA